MSDSFLKNRLKASQNQANELVNDNIQDIKKKTNSKFGDNRANPYGQHNEITENQSRITKDSVKVNRSPKHHAGSLQDLDHDLGENRGKITKDSVRVNKSPNHRAGSLRDLEDDSSMKRSNISNDILQVKKPSQLHASSLRDVSEDEGARKGKITKDTVKATKSPNHKAGSLRDWDERSERRITDNSFSHNDTSLQRSHRDALGEIAARISRNDELKRDSKTITDLSLHSRRDGSMLEISTGLKKNNRLLGESLLNAEKARASASPDHRNTRRDNELERLVEKEIDDLKHKNNQLEEGNHRLRDANDDLEDELARRVQENKRLKQELDRKEHELRDIQNEMAKGIVLNRPLLEVKGPLGSPKAEMFNKKEGKTLKAEPTSRSHTKSSYPPPLHSDKLRRGSRSQVNIGQLIRKNIEGEENLPLKMKNPFKSADNIIMKPQYETTPKREQPLRFTSEPETTPTLKPFQSHENLPFCTILDYFQLACLKDKSILFENEHLVIESQTVLREVLASNNLKLEVLFIYTNKINSELKDFSVTYKNIPNIQITAESANIPQRLNPRETQTHPLSAKLIGPSGTFGNVVIEYRINGEPYQLKMHSPIIITKFLNFLSVSAGEFIRKRKYMQEQYPENVEVSSKFRLSQRHLRPLMEWLFSQMIALESDNERNDRFRVYGGCVKVNGLDGEILVRIIVENETQLALLQVNYEKGYKEYAKNVLKMLTFLCNEKVVLQ